MATIKSHTDLEQSKKLAKILRVESADMHYDSGDECEIRFGNGMYEEIANWTCEGTPRPADIPCWSLASLIKILHCNKEDIVSLSYGGYKDGEYILNWCLDYEFENGDYQKTFADNPVDACVAMIEKLHEQKIL